MIIAVWIVGILAALQLLSLISMRVGSSLSRYVLDKTDTPLLRHELSEQRDTAQRVIQIAELFPRRRAENVFLVLFGLFVILLAVIAL